jgi:uncharacterized protein YkwD
MRTSLAPARLVATLLALSFAASDAAAQPDAVERATLDRVNAYRQEHGRARLSVSERLQRAAEDFAAYMARTGRYGHEADGRRPADRASAAGYAWCLVAENIAWRHRSTGFTDEELVSGFFEGWRDSPDHRKNILDAALTETGIALVRSRATGRWYAVQMFGRPKSAQFAFQVFNRSGTRVRYRVDGQEFDLPPRLLWHHTVCRPAATVAFTLPTRSGGRPRPVSVEVTRAARLAVVTADDGTLVVRRE